MLDRLFQLERRGTTIGTEAVAGLTTFVTMAYIIFVNPTMLAATGMDQGAVFVATCLAAALGSALMGVMANYPIALAPGMGINAYFTFAVVLGGGHPWPVALGTVFVSGCLFLALTATGLREAVINAVPKSLKLAISAGIGLFLGLLALESAGIVVAHPQTLVTLGDLTRPQVVLAAIGFVVMVALDARKVPGAILIAVLGTSVAAMVLGLAPFAGLVSLPPSPMPVLGKLDLAGVFDPALVAVVLAFLFVDLFDNAGTLIGLAQRANLLDADGRLPRAGRVLTADSLAVMASGMLGTSPTVSYIESAAGIKAGGRTGLTALVVAALFLAALFLSPLAGAIPAFATAPALLFVACLMARGLADISWDDLTEAVPAMVTALTMPLTFSIANGIALGFISFVAIKVLAGRWRQVSVTAAVLAVAFVLKYALLGTAGG